MMIISLKPTKHTDLYQFKIHIFYRKLSLHSNSAQIYYFDEIYIITKKHIQLIFFALKKYGAARDEARGHWLVYI